MEEITIDEKSELASGVRARIDELKKNISLIKKLGLKSAFVVHVKNLSLNLTT